jgi:redox-sensitive bicupin YhaK (pirin superfamily)
MIDGRFQHQDSHGGGGMIENGATQWMTAGAGILHIETPPEDLVISGALFHGVQLWVNLPAKSKMIPPAYQSIEAGDVVLVASADAGALVRVIAGEVGGHRGPGSTPPITLLHATVSPGALLQLPWDPSFNALVYVLASAGHELVRPDRPHQRLRNAGSSASSEPQASSVKCRSGSCACALNWTNDQSPSRHFAVAPGGGVWGCEGSGWVGSGTHVPLEF